MTIQNIFSAKKVGTQIMLSPESYKAFNLMKSHSQGMQSRHGRYTILSLVVDPCLPLLIVLANNLSWRFGCFAQPVRYRCWARRKVINFWCQVPSQILTIPCSICIPLFCIWLASKATPVSCETLCLLQHIMTCFVLFSLSCCLETHWHFQAPIHFSGRKTKDGSCENKIFCFYPH